MSGACKSLILQSIFLAASLRIELP